MSSLTASTNTSSTWLQVLTRTRELGIVLALVLLVGATAISNPRFLSAQSLRDLMLGVSVLGILAVGQTLVIITRNVDLSIGSILGLVAFGVGSLLIALPGLPLPVAIVVGMAGGAVLGGLNGSLVVAANVPSLVVTLGTLYVFRGIDFVWAGGDQVTAAELPDGFLALGTAQLLGIPILFLIALVVVAVTGFCLRSYRSGRDLYAIGSDPAAARLSGVPVGRRVLTAFVVNGALTGLAAVLFTARFGQIDANVGGGLELQTVAAAVVGGVAIFGGSGTAWGAAVGAALLTTITSALAVMRIRSFWQQAIVGVLILAAIGLDRLLLLRQERRLRVGGAT